MEAAPAASEQRGPAGLVFEGVSQGYRGGLLGRVRTVLDLPRLELAAGSVTALLGPNGSGKSTLLRLAAGVEPPRTGRVRALGRAPSSSAARARVGFLPEGLPLPDELTALQALRLVARARVAERPRELARAWLGRAGLEAAADRRLPDLSSGMRRRLGLALTFLHAPELVLLDEPSSGLDAQGIALLERLVEAAIERGATVVLCSHRAGDLFHAADRALVLVAGRLAHDGDLASLLVGARRIELELTREPQAELAPALAELRRRDLQPGAPRPAATELDALYRRLAQAPGPPGAER